MKTKPLILDWSPLFQFSKPRYHMNLIFKNFLGLNLWLRPTPFIHQQKLIKDKNDQSNLFGLYLHSWFLGVKDRQIRWCYDLHTLSGEGITNVVQLKPNPISVQKEIEYV